MRNFLRKILNRDIADILTRFYQHTELLEIQWISFAINKNTIANSFLTKELEILTDSDAFSLKIADLKTALNHQLWKNHESEGTSILPYDSTLINDYNILVDNLIEKKIHSYQTKLKNVDSTKTFTPSEVTTEDKALEWMRASFTLLEKAVVKSLTDPELLFQTLLFMGVNPKSNQEEIRLITFNLDIKFEFLSNGMLRIHIYNDKNEETRTAKKPSLVGDFNFRKREMLDELTKLLSSIAQGIKI